MSIHSKIQLDGQNALRAHDAKRRQTLSFLASELKRVAVDTRVSDLDDRTAIDILNKQLKLRREALEFARKAARTDLAEQNEYEIAVIQEYLPKGLSEEEMQTLAGAIIGELKATSVKDMGKVMAEGTKREPALDKARFSAIVKARLSAPPPAA